MFSPLWHHQPDSQQPVVVRMLCWQLAVLALLGTLTIIYCQGSCSGLGFLIMLSGAPSARRGR